MVRAARSTGPAYRTSRRPRVAGSCAGAQRRSHADRRRARGASRAWFAGRRSFADRCRPRLRRGDPRCRTLQVVGCPSRVRTDQRARHGQLAAGRGGGVRQAFRAGRCGGGGDGRPGADAAGRRVTAATGACLGGIQRIEGTQRSAGAGRQPLGGIRDRGHSPADDLGSRHAHAGSHDPDRQSGPVPLGGRWFAGHVHGSRRQRLPCGRTGR